MTHRSAWGGTDAPFGSDADANYLQVVGIFGREVYYFGLAITTGSGSKEVIPFFNPTPGAQAQLEYQITELIGRTARRQKTRLGLLSSLSISGSGM